MILGIYCAGGFGGVTLELAKELNERDYKWDDFVYIDDNVNVVSAKAPVMSYVDFQKTYNSSNAQIVIAAGEPRVRELIFNKVRNKGYDLPNLIHPSANAKKIDVIGNGNIILFSAYISSSNVTLGNNLIIMNHVSVSHDCVIGSHSVLASSSIISGTCNFGDCCYVGANATIREGLTVGEDAIVGMGSVVTKNIEEATVVMGIPAKPISKNQSGNVFKHKGLVGMQ